MKLLGILKEKFEKAETIEDKKKVLAEVGVELTDDELEDVTGGRERVIPYRYRTRTGPLF